jgi:hypothetical protein
VAIKQIKGTSKPGILRHSGYHNHCGCRSGTPKPTIRKSKTPKMPDKTMANISQMANTGGIFHLLVPECQSLCDNEKVRLDATKLKLDD